METDLEIADRLQAPSGPGRGRVIGPPPRRAVNVFVDRSRRVPAGLIEED